MDSKHRSLTYPVVLTTAQLSYILTLLRAERLLGADNQQLLPQDEAKRMQLWQTGQQQLEKEKWLTKKEGVLDLNPQLMLLVATIASAPLVIISQITLFNQPAQGVTHYVSSDSVVEVVYTGNDYELTVLDSTAVMANRLGHTFELPETLEESLTFTMTPEQVDLARSMSTTPADVDLTDDGVKLYHRVVGHLRHTGLIQLNYIDSKQDITNEHIGLLVSSEGIALTAVPQPEKIVYQTTNRQQFQEKLISKLQEGKEAHV